jgi:hypothetical protein
MHCYWEPGVPVTLLGPTTPSQWIRKELRVVPLQSADPAQVYAQLTLGRRPDGTPEQVFLVANDGPSELIKIWEKLVVAQVPTAFLDKMYGGLGRSPYQAWYYPASYRVLVSVPDRGLDKVPKSWDQVE